MQNTAGLLAMRGVDWTSFRLDLRFFKNRPSREGFTYRLRLLSVFAPARSAAMVAADRIPEWLREKNTKPQRTSTADCTQKSLRLSGMPLISAGPGLLLGAIGTAEHKR